LESPWSRTTGSGSPMPHPRTPARLREPPAVQGTTPAAGCFPPAGHSGRASGRRPCVLSGLALAVVPDVGSLAQPCDRGPGCLPGPPLPQVTGRLRAEQLSQPVIPLDLAAPTGRLPPRHPPTSAGRPPVPLPGGPCPTHVQPAGTRACRRRAGSRRPGRPPRATPASPCAQRGAGRGPRPGRPADQAQARGRRPAAARPAPGPPSAARRPGRRWPQARFAHCCWWPAQLSGVLAGLGGELLAGDRVFALEHRVALRVGGDACKAHGSGVGAVPAAGGLPPAAGTRSRTGRSGGSSSPPGPPSTLPLPAPPRILPARPNRSAGTVGAAVLCLEDR
jgi:hypothetical protein